MKKQEETINDLIKSERKKQKLTQLELAEKLGVTKNYITKIEGGANVSIKVLEKIAKALNSELIVKFKRIK